jgi:hypothetical protein
MTSEHEMGGFGTPRENHAGLLDRQRKKITWSNYDN